MTAGVMAGPDNRIRSGRDGRAIAPDLSRLLRPRRIAVFGARPAREVIRQNERLGFAGDIWPVHPTADTVEGRPAFRTVAGLPAPPDAAFLAVNRHATVALVRDLAAAGAGGAVCYAAGFAEAGAEGAALQAALREAAGAMPVLGPNCYGLLNYLDGAALWPDQHGGKRVSRGVALVTQSGNIGLNLTMQRRGLPVAYLLTLGNQAVVGMSAAITALAADPRVTAIGLHVEAIDDAAAFAAAVAAAGKPVVAIKTGASPTGAALALSHTASLATPDAVLDAYLRRLGVARVGTLAELVEALKLLHFHGRLDGADLVSMSCSGGEAALFADRAEGRRVRFRPFAEAGRAAVAATVPALVTVSNPFDYHTFHWANRAAMAATFAAVLRQGFALALLVLDFPRVDRGSDTDWWLAAEALADAATATGRPAAVVATLPECLPEALAERLARLGLVPLCGLDEALSACEAALPVRASLPPRLDAAPAGAPHLLDEWEAKRRLARHGVPVPEGARFADAASVRWRHFPAAVKALGVAHKTEAGALRLGIADPAGLAQAARALAPLGHALLVEAMVLGGVAELIVGFARDATLGPYLLLGSGGVLAELLADRVVLLLPVGADELRAALSTLRVAGLLAGHRGRPAGDVDAAIAAVLAIQDFVLAHLDRLVELDVNPLIVTPSGAVAADALVRLVELPA